MRFDVGRDAFQGTLRTLTKNRDRAFELLALALAEARFDADAIERMRNQILVGLERDAEDPDTVAQWTLMPLVFPDHSYGRRVSGTPDGVRAITRDDLQGFVARRFARDNLVIGIVGDITPDELKPLLDKTFGPLPARAQPWRLAEARPMAGGEIRVVKMAVPQSAILFTQPGVKRSDPDFYAAFVLNHILGGGGFTSRLYEQVREKRGLAYSVYSSLYPLDHAALIFGGAGTANARVAETVRVVRAEWDRLAQDGVTTDELEAAKTYLTGSFPLRFTSSRRIAGMLVGMQLDDLGIDYFDRRNDYVEAVTITDVNRLARRLLSADALTIVVVGEPDGLEGG
jgi:zinc protease